MAIRYAIESHAWGAPAKVKSAIAGHIYNIQISEDYDNTNFLAKNDYLSFDLYSDKTATGFSGIVREQAANGNYYVEVVDPGDALLRPQSLESSHSGEPLGLATGPADLGV